MLYRQQVQVYPLPSVLISFNNHRTLASPIGAILFVLGT